mmetsp:Transcript_22327/g.33452  ORF Transcript_22327/g.33452 Transcript_22327/m.33452 type:complete len:208 (-) Transcript_22327:307-930(-)
MAAFNPATTRNESSNTRRGRALSLSSSLPPSYGSSPTRPAQRHHKTSLSQSITSSAPISLPKSHIRRTPSELQMADDIRRAEYEDVRMYARLVVGMQTQCVASGYVHPRTRQILQDIVKTKEANDQELEALHHHQEEDDSGWDVNYIEEQEEYGSQAPPCHQMGARISSVSPDNIVKAQSNSSMSNSLGADVDDNDDGEEGVFSMDL